MVSISRSSPFPFPARPPSHWTARAKELSVLRARLQCALPRPLSWSFLPRRGPMACQCLPRLSSWRKRSLCLSHRRLAWDFSIPLRLTFSSGPELSARQCGPYLEPRRSMRPQCYQYAPTQVLPDPTRRWPASVEIHPCLRALQPRRHRHSRIGIQHASQCPATMIHHHFFSSCQCCHAVTTVVMTLPAAKAAYLLHVPWLPAVLPLQYYAAVVCLPAACQ